MIKILHLIPGRVRLRLEMVKGRPEVAQRVRTHLEAVTDINQVTVNSRTGSLLVLYDARALYSPVFMGELSEALGKLFPGHFAPGHLRVTLRQLQGKPELARALQARLAPVRGIRRIEIDPTGGSCRLVYDSKLATVADFLDALSDALNGVLPRANLRRLLARAGLQRR